MSAEMMRVCLLLAIVSSALLSSVLADVLDYDEETGQLKQTSYAAILEELRGAHLRIAATNLSNTMIIQKNPNGTFNYDGYAVDAVQYMAELFHFNYSFVNTRVEELAKLGPRETEVNTPLRNEADITVTPIVLSLSVFSRMDVSIPLYTAGTALMVPWPEEESRLLAPIYPFQPTVWLTLLVGMVVMAFILTWLPDIYDKFFGTVTISSDSNPSIFIGKFGDGFHAIVANITGRSGAWSTRKQLFYRILLGSWCLAAFVLVHAYSSLLISYLTVPKLMPVPKNYDDLAFNDYHKNNWKTIANKNSITTDMMSGAIYGTSKNRPDPQNKLFRRASFFTARYRKHPEWLFTTPQQRFDLLSTGRAAYGVNEHLFYSLLDELNKKAGYCKITASTKRIDDLLDFTFVLLYRKNWRYTDAMRNKMQWWRDTGLALRWIENYQPSAKDCLLQDYKKNAPSIRVLTLNDLSSAFVLLLLGCALSLLVFLVEKIYYKISIIRRG